MSKYDELVDKLKEIFELKDTAQLDFGIYRILHARADKIKDFLEKRLQEKVREQLSGNAAAQVESLKMELQKARADAERLKIEDVDATPMVQELKAKLAQFNKLDQTENDVYSHLLTFFGRYYEKGDFISKRRYKGNTYAIPYSGEEVKLHWANADQYYIKSSEHFSNYTFTLANGKKVHFIMVHAALPFGNQKDNEAEHRYVLWNPADAPSVDATGDEEQEAQACYPDKTVEIKEGELCIYFRYARLAKGSKQEQLSDDTEKTVLATLTGNASMRADFSDLSTTAMGKTKTILRRHLDAYVARNTMDYFIHKDLKGFLSRELDFYIKNEIMHLDDIQDSTSAKQLERSLKLIQVFRSIANDLIDFMAQLENFQKRLWLKQKFVTQCEYCITMDRVPENLRSAVLSNQKQMQEWERLGTLQAPASGVDARMVDTKFFDEDFKAKLLASIDNLDENCNGVLFHSENFAALRLMKDKYKGEIDAIYIDPPYNTGDDGFLYKDSYMDSSWLCMINDRVAEGVALLRRGATMMISIGDEEQEYLSTCLRNSYGKNNLFATLVWEKKMKGSYLNAKVARMKDYIICLTNDSNQFSGLIGEIKKDPSTYPCINPGNKLEIRTIKSGITSNYREKDVTRPAGHIISSGNMQLELIDELIIKDGFLSKDVRIRAEWRYSQATLDMYANSGQLYITRDLYLRVNMIEERRKVMKDLLLRLGSEATGKNNEIDNYSICDLDCLERYGWGSNENANEELLNLLGVQYAATYPKPEKLVKLLFASLRKPDGVYLDYFSGSGTSGHAVISLNRQDNGTRKYCLVEMGDTFDNVLLPRLKKVVYSPEWLNGVASAKEKGISHCFKYMRLESYEDTLNNLQLEDAEEEVPNLLRDEYLLRYMLPIESRKSFINTDSFRKPFDYKLQLSVDSNGGTEERKVDLPETFNYLIGLTVTSYDRHVDKGYMMVVGTLPDRSRALVIWRDVELVDDDALHQLLERRAINPTNEEYDVIYVNGDHSLSNSTFHTEKDGRMLTIRSIETNFKELMFMEEN